MNAAAVWHGGRRCAVRFDRAACRLQSAVSNMKYHSQFRSALGGVVVGTTLLLGAPPAHSQPGSEPEVEGDATAGRPAAGLQFSLSVEPGLAIALTDPQAQRTEAGFGQTLKLLFDVTPYLGLGPTASVTTLPAAAAMPTSGAAWAFGGGARLMRPA